MAITSANQLELLQTAEAVAREKMIDPGLVVEAMEESLARAAKSRYGSELDIRVQTYRKTGRATFTRVRPVLAAAERETCQAEFLGERATQTRGAAVVRLASRPWPACSSTSPFSACPASTNPFGRRSPSPQRATP